MLVAPRHPRLLWFVHRTKPKQERAVVETLTARAVAAYCLRVIEPRWHRRVPRGAVPLFPSYAFARSPAADSFGAVNSCPVAAGIVRFAAELVALDDAAIDELRGREGERGYVEIKAARERRREGRRVRVERGLLAGFEGVVMRHLPARDRVRPLLAMIGGVCNVEVDACHVRHS